jgi:hypothetical protein
MQPMSVELVGVVFPAARGGEAAAPFAVENPDGAIIWRSD